MNSSSNNNYLNQTHQVQSQTNGVFGFFSKLIGSIFGGPVNEVADQLSDEDIPLHKIQLRTG